MDQLVVGCVQGRIRLPQNLTELEQHLMRFVRMAQSKRVRLLVFPQFTGLMTSALLTLGTRTALLKQADQARRSNVSFWTRARARLAGSAASALGTDFSRVLADALEKQPDLVWDSYTALFSDIARRYAMTLVAGSGYLVDPNDGAVRHMSLVFGPDGTLLGQQGAVSLTANEHPAVQPGRRWQAIQTPAGRLGILIGDDMLYPESGRLLAYAGAEILVGMGASTIATSAQRQRQGLLARVEENQLYGLMSFAVGYNPFTRSEETPFVGRSLIAAPLRMTPRTNGVLVEMGTDAAEGLITAEWSFDALKQLWDNDDTPVRAAMPMKVVGPALSAIYVRGLTIEEATRIGELSEGPPALPEPMEPEEAVDAATLTETEGLPTEEDGLPTAVDEEEVVILGPAAAGDGETTEAWLQEDGEVSEGSADIVEVDTEELVAPIDRPEEEALSEMDQALREQVDDQLPSSGDMPAGQPGE